jgi:8-oxo-dGTP pyrophosphatase MutT (NUDIX family)
MPRAPFQILVVPFRRVGEQFEFAVLRRQDMDVWQAVAGGGESGESPQQAAVREAREELGLDPDAESTERPGSTPLFPAVPEVRFNAPRVRRGRR